MEKRVLLAIFLVFLFLFVYQGYVVRQSPNRPQVGSESGPVASGSGGGASQAGPGSGASGQGDLAAAAAGGGSDRAGSDAAAARAEVATTVSEAQEREIVVETGVLRVVFSNRGARATGWVLADYRDSKGNAVDLVPGSVRGASHGMFDLTVDDEAATERLAGALFSSGASGLIDGRRAAATVAFDYADSSGLVARKVFTFRPNSYLVEVTATVNVGSRTLNPTVQLGPGLGDLGVESAGNSYMQAAGGILHQNGKVRRVAVKDLSARPVEEGTFRYAGIDDQYFLSVVLPERMVRVEYRPVAVPTGNGKAFNYVEWGVRQAKSAEGLKLYVGPKDFDVLAAVDRELVRSINYGIFDWLAVPLLRALKGINGRIGNYGWSIIVLTVLINIVMFPLRHKSVVSMKRMQELQPEIKAIQARYGKLKATDPAKQKMNQEVMELYKSKGVNPASGCVPMLLTIPIFIAFYSLLSQAIELRGAPFVFWIEDLSVHDPYYVTPVLMGGAWLWQQWMTPSSADPVQQKMFLAMPVVFTIMFLWAPSGLAIYWFVNNLLGIAQQYATNRLVGRRRAGVVVEKRRKGVAAADEK